jgi:hypothetical protein
VALAVCAIGWLLGSVSVGACAEDPEGSQFGPTGSAGGGGSTSSGEGGCLLCGGNDATSSSAGVGGMLTCASPEDCPGMDTDCQFKVCDNMTCQLGSVAANTPCDDGGGNLCNGSGQCISCGQTQQAPGSSNCPTACTGGCNGNVCNIDCSGSGLCQGQTISCPADFECALSCGNDGCKSATIGCQPNYHCGISCNGSSACEGATINCSGGICDLSCSADANSCSGTLFNCSVEQCSATCAGNSQPTLDCLGNSCSCTGC